MSDKSKYNPNIHHRKSLRLKGYDYSQAGLYFITICCQNRRHRFGNITVGSGFSPAQNNTGIQMVLNDYGMVAHNEWIKLSERFPNIQLDSFQIMPNHMHGILSLNNLPATSNRTSVNTGFITAQINTQHDENVQMNWNNTDNRDKEQPQGLLPRLAPTVSDIVGAYKSLVNKGCLDIYKSKNRTMGKLWQRNYYEHIIRNEISYHRISTYINNNPAKWAEDKFYIK